MLDVKIMLFKNLMYTVLTISSKFPMTTLKHDLFCYTVEIEPFKKLLIVSIVSLLLKKMQEP